jgi:hypothetical protein
MKRFLDNSRKKSNKHGKLTTANKSRRPKRLTMEFLDGRLMLAAGVAAHDPYPVFPAEHNFSACVGQISNVELRGVCDASASKNAVRLSIDMAKSDQPLLHNIITNTTGTNQGSGASLRMFNEREPDDPNDPNYYDDGSESRDDGCGGYSPSTPDLPDDLDDPFPPDHNPEDPSPPDPDDPFPPDDPSTPDTGEGPRGDVHDGISNVVRDVSPPIFASDDESAELDEDLRNQLIAARDEFRDQLALAKANDDTRDSYTCVQNGKDTVCVSNYGPYGECDYAPVGRQVCGGAQIIIYGNVGPQKAGEGQVFIGPVRTLTTGGDGNDSGDDSSGNNDIVPQSRIPDPDGIDHGGPRAMSASSRIGVLAAIEAKDGGGSCVTGPQGATWTGTIDGQGYSCQRANRVPGIGQTVCVWDSTGKMMDTIYNDTESFSPYENPCGDEGYGHTYHEIGTPWTSVEIGPVTVIRPDSTEEITEELVEGTIDYGNGKTESMYIPYEEVHCTLTETGGGEQSQRETGSSGSLENENEGHESGTAGQGATEGSQSGGEALASNDTTSNDNDDGSNEQSDDWDPFGFPDPDGDEYGGPRARPDTFDLAGYAVCPASANPADRLSLVEMPDPESDGGPVGPNARSTVLDGRTFARGVDTVMASLATASTTHQAILSSANPADRLSLVEMPNPEDDGGPVGANAHSTILSGRSYAASVDAVMASLTASAAHRAMRSTANPADRLSLVEMPNPDDDGGPVGPNARASAFHGQAAVQHIEAASVLATGRAYA